MSRVYVTTYYMLIIRDIIIHSYVQNAEQSQFAYVVTGQINIYEYCSENDQLTVLAVRSLHNTALLEK